jgi:RimJ/RimL family protein N-acetyltransferase
MSDYKDFVTGIIRDFKNNYFADKKKYSIPLMHKGAVVGRLRPVPTEFNDDAVNDVRLQTKWRNTHADSFLVDPFVATEERTLNWLKDIYIHNNERIIFMIEDRFNQPIGHLALENFIFDEEKCEYGRLMRGDISIQEKKDKINLIELAQIAVLNWAFNVLKLKSVYGTQFTHNYPVSRLHEKCGFKTIDEYALMKNGKQIGVSKVELRVEEFTFYSK